MSFRFTGHESFPCRYTWLPKAYRALIENPILFKNDNGAMVRLGVGKNMVNAIRFWVQAFGIATPRQNQLGLFITSFGHAIFHNDGLDPFLEDIRTLWLLHWKLSTISDEPLFAWHFLMNQWAEPEFSRSEIIRAFDVESARQDRTLSSFTKEQHFDIFLHTYVPVRARKLNVVSEETLDCPLTELRLILPAGERALEEIGKRESVYSFRQDIKTEITGALLAYCIYDFWQNNRQQEGSLSFYDISSAANSVGQVFKLSEPDVRTRLEMIRQDSQGIFEYHSSASLPRVVRGRDFDGATEAQLLTGIYHVPVENYFAVQMEEVLA